VTDKTATQNLTRTTVTDDPKQMNTYLETLAKEVDRRAAAHVYDLGRSSRPPFAIVRQNVETIYDTTGSPSIPWDTVEEDTAGLVDLSVSDTVINLRQAGYWCVGAYVHTTGFGSAASDTSLHLLAGSESTVGAVRDQAIGLAAVSVDLMVKITVPNLYFARAYIDFAGASLANTTFLRFAEMWAYKVRDL
jgi:hypothetical protein